MQQAVKKMTDAGKHLRTAIDVELFQKEDRAGVLSLVKAKGVDKLKERKAFASLIEEKAG